MANRLAKPFYLGFILGAFLLGLPYLVVTDYFKGEPYEVTKVTYNVNNVSGGTIELRASFIKKDCEFLKLAVFGEYLGEWFIIPWKDIDHIGENTDRLVGGQTLRISIGPLDYTFSSIEVRTRHDCNGEKVDKVFTRLELNLNG
jgi:hypothetical protein